MKPYVIQNFKSELGEVASSKLISTGSVAVRDLEPFGPDVTINAEDRTVYSCGVLSSLTVASLPDAGEFMLIFTSGAMATTLTVPQTLVMPDSFTVEANTRYEINIRDGYALCSGWAVNVNA